MRPASPTPGRSACVRLGLALLTLAFLGACATAPAPGPAPTTRSPRATTAATPQDLEQRALLLLLADRKTYEPVVVANALGGDPELRYQTALAIGRIGDPRGGPSLASLLADAEPRVRRAAAFALGELGEAGYAQGVTTLLDATADPDREVGRLAVEALAKTGVPLEEVVKRLVEVPSDELLPRLVPALYRFDSDAVLRWAELGLEDDDPKVRKMAAFALAREPRPEGAPLLRTLLADPDPWVRGYAARALGRVGERADVDRLRPLLDAPEPGPIIQALRAARSLLDAGEAAPPRDWQPRLLALLQDPRPGVRLTAIEASTAWLLDEALGAALERFARSGLRRERELAMLALAEAEDPRALPIVLDAAGDPDPVLRARAAAAAGLLRRVDVLDRLARDEHPAVRRAALETILAGEPPDAEKWVSDALVDPDPTVRATALAWAEAHPVFDYETLIAVLGQRDPLLDARIAGVEALAARALAEPLERGAIVAALETLAEDKAYRVRRAAVAALATLDRVPPAVGPARPPRPVAIYRQILHRIDDERRVALDTERGRITIELACREAPLTCVNFLQLAAQGFYDGLTFHRVVPDFVVQAGDPRGDGWGGPGYALRDEVNLLRYDRGTVGMAHSGPDTAGSQFFITLSPQPHLDGGYTIFGRVVSGDEILDRIVQGDRILAAAPLEN